MFLKWFWVGICTHTLWSTSRVLAWDVAWSVPAPSSASRTSPAPPWCAAVCAPGFSAWHWSTPPPENNTKSRQKNQHTHSQSLIWKPVLLSLALKSFLQAGECFCLFCFSMFWNCSVRLFLLGAQNTACFWIRSDKVGGISWQKKNCQECFLFSHEAKLAGYAKPSTSLAHN